MSQYINKSHNVTTLLYYLVFPAKYRRAVFDDDVNEVLKKVCLGIEQRYEIKFLEIGTEKDHVHSLVQSVPKYSVTKIVTMLKSITAKEIFKRCPQVKKKLWGGVLDGWIFCKYGRQAWRRGDDRQVHKESRTRVSKATFRFSARAVLNTPPLWSGDFYYLRMMVRSSPSPSSFV